MERRDGHLFRKQGVVPLFPPHPRKGRTGPVPTGGPRIHHWPVGQTGQESHSARHLPSLHTPDTSLQRYHTNRPRVDTEHAGVRLDKHTLSRHPRVSLPCVPRRMPGGVLCAAADGVGTASRAHSPGGVPGRNPGAHARRQCSEDIPIRAFVRKIRSTGRNLVHLVVPSRCRAGGDMEGFNPLGNGFVEPGASGLEHPGTRPCRLSRGKRFSGVDQ